MKSFQKIAGLLATLALSVAGLTLVAAPAHAAEVPADQRLSPINFNSSSNLGYYTGFDVAVAGPGATPTPGVQAVLRSYDCHGRLTGTSVPQTFGSDPVNHVYLIDVVDGFNHRVGPLNWSLDLTHPGFDTYQLTGTYNPRSLPCEADTDTEQPKKLTVKKWSKKVPSADTAKVGRKLRITTTKSNADSTIYTWTVGKKVVKAGSNRVLKLKKAYKGKAVKVHVLVKKGDSEAARTLRFGRVRK